MKNRICQVSMLICVRSSSSNCASKVMDCLRGRCQSLHPRWMLSGSCYYIQCCFWWAEFGGFNFDSNGLELMSAISFSVGRYKTGQDTKFQYAPLLLVSTSTPNDLLFLQEFLLCLFLYPTAQMFINFYFLILREKTCNFASNIVLFIPCKGTFLINIEFTKQLYLSREQGIKGIDNI